MKLAGISRVAKQTLKRLTYGATALIVGFSGMAVAVPLFLSPSAYAAGNTLYVNASTGDDRHTCLDSANPCRTIAKAVQNSSSGDTIDVESGTYNLTAELDITIPLTIVGQGSVTIKSNNSSWDTTNNGKHIIGIYAGTSTSPVSISNVTIDSNSQSYGVNTYDNAYGILNNVTIQNSKGAALTVNGSTIVATNLNTSNNSWGAVNVDPGSGVTTPSVFTLNSGTLSEINQIWSDGSHVTGAATVTVNASGYTEYHISDTGYNIWTNNLKNVASISNGSTTSYYSTIQAAVNAASSGDIINVAAGTYNSFSVSSKSNLTITGAGAGSTIVAPTALVNSGIQHKYTSNMQVSVLVNGSTGITIQGMTIKDNGLAPGSGGPDALVFWNASTGTLSNDSITGTYTINGIQSGQAIAVDGNSGTVSLTVSGSTLSGFQKNGIDVIDGNGATSGATDTTTLTVNNSTTITGAGSTSAIAQNGIVLWDRGGGTITGTVNGSTISGFQYTPLDVASGNNGTGILTYGTSASVTVTNSSLTGSDLDAANATSSGTFNATNNYWGTSPNFTSIIGQTSDGYGTVSYKPYYLDSGKTAVSNVANLTALSLSSGTLSPAFSSGTTSYSATVANSVTSVTASYTASTGASVVVNGGSLAVGANTVSVVVTSADGMVTKTYTITVNRAAATQTLPDSSGNATVNSSTPQVVVTSTSQPVTVNVSSGTTNATIDYSALKTGNSAVVPQTTINTQNANVQIQAGTTITASSSSWNGTITAPTVQSNTSVTVPTASGTATTVGTVIEVGADGINLTFDKAARLVIPGQAGKLVGFDRNGNFTQITTACSADSQAVGNALPAGGDCYISVGSDMVVWTKHFTKFVTYTTSNTYVVQPGDTMYSIAHKFGLTLAQLEALNPTAGHPAGNFGFILPGDILKVGSAKEITTASAVSTGNGSGVLGSQSNTPAAGGKTSSTSTLNPKAATTSNVAAAKKASGLAWYWWVVIAAAVLAVGAAYYIYRFAESVDKKS